MLSSCTAVFSPYSARVQPVFSPYSARVQPVLSLCTTHVCAACVGAYLVYVQPVCVHSVFSSCATLCVQPCVCSHVCAPRICSECSSSGWPSAGVTISRDVSASLEGKLNQGAGEGLLDPGGMGGIQGG